MHLPKLATPTTLIVNSERINATCLIDRPRRPCQPMGTFHILAQFSGNVSTIRQEERRLDPCSRRHNHNIVSRDFNWHRSRACLNHYRLHIGLLVAVTVHFGKFRAERFKFVESDLFLLPAASVLLSVLLVLLPFYKLGSGTVTCKRNS